MSRIAFLTFAAMTSAIFLSTAAQAHPKLVAATPAANATVARPTTIELRFSERLTGQFSGVEIMMTGMPGMKDHPPTKMTGITTAVGADGKTLVARSRTPLPVGTYTLNWHVVGGDTHRVNGSYNFAVR